MATSEPSGSGDVREALQAIRRGVVKPWRRLPGRNVTKADVSFYRFDGRGLAVKDYRPRPWVVRHVLGRWLIRRECRAYQAAAGARGLPRFLGRIHPCALAVEYVDGETLGSMIDRRVDPDVFDRLEGIVAGLHARGVALGDLHHRDVLVSVDGEVRVVDLAMSWVVRDDAGRASRWLFHRLAELDAIAVARMRARWTGGDPDAAVAAAGGGAASWYARGRRLKAVWNRLRGR